MSVPLPYDIEPMKAVLGDLPTEPVGWAYEIKWDGMRALAFVDGDLSMRSTRHLELAGRFPELAGLATGLEGHRVALDGEVVAFDDEARSDFALLQHRMHIADRSEAIRRSSEVPVNYIVFDLLHLDGIDTTPLPYEERRRLLLDLVEPGPTGRCPPTHSATARRCWTRRRSGIWKDWWPSGPTARYEPGRRSGAWRKVKIRGEQEFVVGGWSTGRGNRSDVFGSLALGYHHDHDPDGPLVYAGNVGTGFSGPELARLQALLDGARHRHLPVRADAPAFDRSGHAVGPPRARGRGGVQRVDPRRPVAPPRLPRHADRQVARRGRARGRLRASPADRVADAMVFVTRKDRVPPNHLPVWREFVTVVCTTSLDADPVSARLARQFVVSRCSCGIRP